MKTNLIATLANGLSVSFPVLEFTRHPFSVTLEDFAVTFGETVTLTRSQLFDIANESLLWDGVVTIAESFAKDLAQDEAREFAELREWLDRRR